VFQTHRAKRGICETITRERPSRVGRLQKTCSHEFSERIQPPIPEAAIEEFRQDEQGEQDGFPSAAQGTESFILHPVPSLVKKMV
jgi:hypothetical protein